MKICFLSSMHEPTDKRVHHKEARSLVRAGGFAVAHIAPGDGSAYDLDGVAVTTYAGGKTIGARLMKFPRLVKLAVAQKPDVYHCNEVESWLAGVVASWFTGARVIFDAHEIYSHDLAESRFPEVLRPAVIAGVRLFYRALLPFTARVVLAKASAGEDFKNVKTPLVLVQNYAELGDFLPPAKKHTDSNNVTILHLGAINRQRGWPQMLEALARTKNAGIRLRILGKFGDGSGEEFLQKAQALGLENRVTVNDWVPYEQVMQETGSADIGLILFQPVMHNFTHALPHKMFDYMLAGLPVIAPDFAVEVSRNIRDADAGLLVDPTNIDAIAAAMDKLANDNSLRNKLGEQGRRAVMEKYNWEKEADTFVTMYKTLAAETHKRPGLKIARLLAGLMKRRPDLGNDTDCYFFHPEHAKSLTGAELKAHQDHSSQWRYDYEMEEKTLEHCFEGKSAFAHLLQDKTVLDFGCFMGGTSVAWQKLYGIKKIYGFDTDAMHAEAANAFAAKMGANAEFTHSFGESLPYAAGQFDTILSLDVFEHVKDVGRCLKECARVLKPEGRVIAIFPQYFQPAAHHLKTTATPFLHWIFSGETLLELQNDMFDELGPEYGHFKLSGLDGYKSPYLNGIMLHQFRRLAAEAGFDIELHVRHGFPRMGRAVRRNPLFRAPSAINKYLSCIPLVEEITLDHAVMILKKKS